MAAITVGVPVYNGAQFLEECLDCLERQTFKDFEVLIYDNASTDATPDIAKQFVMRDARFHYVRQPENVGPVQNFIDSMEAARTPFFLWRAHDDLSSENFLECTYRAISSTPGAKLAVGVMERVNLNKTGRRKVYPFPLLAGPKILQIQKLLFGSHAGWIYGLWDLKTLKQCFHSARDAYPYVWAHDYLTLYPVLIDCAVGGTNETRVVKRIVRKAPVAGTKHRRTIAQKENRVRMRTAFLAHCQNVLGQRAFSPTERLILRWMTWHYAGMRTVPMRRAIAYRALLLMHSWRRPFEEAF